MADSASDLRAEIEKLERKHNDNPEGRYLVPLATLHRKAGNTEMAEALLREALNRRSDNLSAHIVLGGCLLDRGALGDSAEAFQFVLSADPQNLIALRSLGEIYRAQGQTSKAERWYRELLAVDPMNEEAHAALNDLAAASVAEAGELASEPSPALPGEGFVDLPSTTDAAAAPAPAGSAPPELDVSPMEMGLVDLDFNLQSEGEPSAPVDHDRDNAAAAPSSPGEPEDERYAAWDPSMMTLEAPTWGNQGAPAADLHRNREDGFSFGDDDALLGANVSLDADSDFADPPGALEEDNTSEVVTETIAELYARQGFHDRAAEVYRELIRRGGEDPVLVERLAEMERLTREDAVDAPDLALDDLPRDLPDLPPAAAENEPSSAAPDTFADSFAQGFAGAENVPAAEPGESETPALPALAADADLPTDSALSSLGDAPSAAGDLPEISLGESKAEMLPYAAPDLEVAPEWDATPEMPPEVEPAAAPDNMAPEPPEEAEWSPVPQPDDTADEWVVPSTTATAEPRSRAPQSAREYLCALADWPQSVAADEVTPAGEGERAPLTDTTSAYGAPDEESEMPWLTDQGQAVAPAAAEPEPLDIAELAAPAEAAPPAVPELTEDDLFPWETTALEPETEAEPQSRAGQDAPAAPAAGDGSGFSFESFFAEPPAAAAPPPPPAPPAEPAAAVSAVPPTPAGAVEDEDLESFQVWLRSLKR